MVVDKRFENGKTIMHYRGIERRVLRNMNGDELAVELERVEAEIRKVNVLLDQSPSWLRVVPRFRNLRNVLYAEKRHIDRELKQRAASLTLGIGWTDAIEVAA